jgi:hypothetical protein
MTAGCRGLALTALLLSCSGNKPAGVVPVDLRDLESDSEGLFSAVFGSLPEHAVAWDSAAQVASLARAAWTRAKSATPGLPKTPSGAVDQALDQSDAAIAKRDQQAAAYAANAISLSIPELFAYFNPDSPVELQRMDATFRQLGLDGHYQKTTGVQADLDSLAKDWNALKATVARRVSTCHRVIGTATISADIEHTFANARSALGSSDWLTLEKESDNGGAEVDTLELLYACPPDDQTPDSGLGSKCSSASSCGNGLVCDLANSGGRCAPDPATAKIGTPCTSTTDCGSDSRSACQTESGDNFPGGYCSMEPCDDVNVCPPGSTCVSLGGETPACFKTCTDDSDCRTDAGYMCQRFSTTPPVGFGPSALGCAFPCTRDTDCQSPFTCNVASGRCTP